MADSGPPPAVPPDALAILEQYRAAREAGDPAALLAAAREAFAAAFRNAEARAFAALTDEIGKLLAKDADPKLDEVETAFATAWNNLDREARAAILAVEHASPAASAQPLTNWRDAKEPPAVVWQHDDLPGEKCNPLVSVGEPAILSGAGGTGKSYVALALALSAVQAGKGHQGDSLGFGVRGGPVLVAAYEDSGPRLAGRVGRIAGGRRNIPDGLYVLPDPGPLFVTGGPFRPGEVAPTATWQALWDGVAEIRPSLIVLDPAAELIEGADANQPGPVRAFMRALAAKSEEHGCGALIIAHDTKASRNAMKRGEGPDAGAVAGSAAWQDRARGVAYMARAPDFSADRLLGVVKSNHGETEWGVRLAPQRNRFEGFNGWRKVAEYGPGEMPWNGEPKPEPARTLDTEDHLV